MGKFQEWFPQLYSLIVDVGFPPPRTHVSWMFAYRDSMTQVLAAAGILVDCSVCYGGMHYLPDRFLLADSRNRRSGKPYRLDESNHCAEGSSTVIELPVSGGLADYWEPDEKGEFRYFYPVASDTEIDRQLQLFQKRLDTLSMLEVDIFHIHFHLYDFLLPNGIAEERLKRVKWLLTSMAYDTRVYFSNASEAADDWSQEHEI